MYVSAPVQPMNMQPGLGGKDRDVFEDWVRAFEMPQMRYKPPERTNEIVVLNRDDVGLKCPSLLPGPMPGLPPPPAGSCGMPPPERGDGYINAFGVITDDGLNSLFPDSRRDVIDGTPKVKLWHFPRNPRQGSLVLNRITLPGKTLGPVDAVDDPTKCSPNSGDRLRLRLSGATAGAINSIRFGGYEYIKQLRHASEAPREAALQLSVATNIPSGGTDQQNRANEAGGHWNQGLYTSSRQLVLASGRLPDKRVSAYTLTQASWWRKPGSTLRYGQFKVLNTTDLSPFQIAKRVTVGRDSFSMVQGVEVPAGQWSMRVASRVTVDAALNRALAFHTRTQQWQVLPRSRTLKASRYGAVVVANANGTRAIGFALTDFPRPPKKSDYYPKAFYGVNVTNKKSTGTLLSAVHQVGVRGWRRPLPARMYSYHTTWHVGPLDRVAHRLATLVVGGGQETCRPQKKWVHKGLLTDVCEVGGDDGGDDGGGDDVETMAAWPPAAAARS